jgi:F0F1-type ATP synthase delta subunit
MAFELPEAIYSPQLLEMVIYDLEQYNEWLRSTNVKKLVGVASESNEPNHSQETLLVIAAWQKEKNSTEASLTELVDVLQKLQIPIVHVTLAALPNHTQRLLLVRWVQALSMPRPLLLFSADRTLGGGVIVRTPNHIFDWSFRQKLEDGKANLGQAVVNA